MPQPLPGMVSRAVLCPSAGLEFSDLTPILSHPSFIQHEGTYYGTLGFCSNKGHWASAPLVGFLCYEIGAWSPCSWFAPSLQSPEISWAVRHSLVPYPELVFGDLGGWMG